MDITKIKTDSNGITSGNLVEASDITFGYAQIGRAHV